MLSSLMWPVRAYFSRLLRAVPAPSALFEIWNSFFSNKNSKKSYRLREKFRENEG